MGSTEPLSHESLPSSRLNLFIVLRCFSVWQVLEEIRAYGIDIYQFPADDEVVADSNTATNVRKEILFVF